MISLTLLIFITLGSPQSSLGKTTAKAKTKPTRSESIAETPTSASKIKVSPKAKQGVGQIQESSVVKTKKKTKGGSKAVTEQESSPKSSSAPTDTNSPKRKNFDPSDIMETDQREMSRNRYGIVGGYLNNDMRGTFTFGGKNQTADMKGKGFGLSGYFEHQFSGPFFARALAGIEQYQASVVQATSVCDGGKTNLCSVELLNLAMQAQAKVAVVVSRVPLWIGGGLGFWVPLSKKSTVFDASSIGPMLVYVLSAGLDIPLFGQRFPFFLDYVVLSGGATVSGDSLILRIGYSWD